MSVHTSVEPGWGIGGKHSERDMWRGNRPWRCCLLRSCSTTVGSCEVFFFLNVFFDYLYIAPPPQATFHLTSSFRDISESWQMNCLPWATQRRVCPLCFFLVPRHPRGVFIHSSATPWYIFYSLTQSGSAHTHTHTHTHILTQSGVPLPISIHNQMCSTLCWKTSQRMEVERKWGWSPNQHRRCIQIVKYNKVVIRCLIFFLLFTFAGNWTKKKLVGLSASLTSFFYKIHFTLTSLASGPD